MQPGNVEAKKHNKTPQTGGHDIWIPYENLAHAKATKDSACSFLQRYEGTLITADRELGKGLAVARIANKNMAVPPPGELTKEPSYLLP